MRRNLVILTVAITLIAIAIGIYKRPDKTSPSSQYQPQAQSDKLEATEGVDSQSSRYVQYSPSTYQSSAASRRILFFYANWCPTCKPTDQDLKANESKIPENVTVIRVNYNDTDTDAEEKALAQKYAVTYQHTFVQIDQNGNEVTKWNGGRLNELLKNIK